MTRRPTIAEFYSEEAESYRELWAPELLPLSRALLPRLPLSSSGVVLEVAAGVGALLPHIRRAAPGATIVAVDLAEGMIALAPPAFPRAVMDAARMALRPESVDVCILAFVLFHVPEPVSALEEVHRVSQDEGTVATITWGRDPGYTALEIWNEELETHGASLGQITLSRHELVDTHEKVEGLLQAAGFTSVRTWSGRYERQMTPEDFLVHCTGHGMSRYRYESLEPEARELCLEAVRRRVRGLDACDLHARAEVIYATARR